MSRDYRQFLFGTGSISKYIGFKHVIKLLAVHSLHRYWALLALFFVRTGDRRVGLVVDVDGDLLWVQRLSDKAVPLKIGIKNLKNSEGAGSYMRVLEKRVAIELAGEIKVWSVDGQDDALLISALFSGAKCGF